MSVKTANISATIYDGSFDIAFDCSGVKNCRFALCSLMPPDGSELCSYNHYSCQNVDAQLEALKNLKNSLLKKIKELNEEAV